MPNSLKQAIIKHGRDTFYTGLKMLLERHRNEAKITCSKACMCWLVEETIANLEIAHAEEREEMEKEDA